VFVIVSCFVILLHLFTADEEGEGLEEVELQVQSVVLARLLGCISNVAQQQLVHMEVMVTKELKRQRQEEQEKTPRKRTANPKKVIISLSLEMKRYITIS